jgi:hypothetical protein
MRDRNNHQQKVPSDLIRTGLFVFVQIVINKNAVAFVTLRLWHTHRSLLHDEHNAARETVARIKIGGHASETSC